MKRTKRLSLNPPMKTKSKPDATDATINGSPIEWAAARKAVDAGWDLDVPEPERQFFYMPFEHAENEVDQARALKLMEERLAQDPDMALHAPRRHRWRHAMPGSDVQCPCGLQTVFACQPAWGRAQPDAPSW